MVDPIQSYLQDTSVLVPIRPQSADGGDGGSAQGREQGAQAQTIRQQHEDSVDLGNGARTTFPPSTALARRDVNTLQGQETDRPDETGGFRGTVSFLYQLAVTQYTRIASLVTTPQTQPGYLFEYYA